MLPYLVGAIIVVGLPTIYVAVRYREYGAQNDSGPVSAKLHGS
jgi:hypothetical protein